GLVIHDERVVSIVAGSPGASAGIVPGDRLRDPSERPGEAGLLRGPLGRAAVGRPLTLELERDGRRALAWMVPEPLPASERRMIAVLLAVASGFVLIGGWVWSERRDPLTRAFFLLCLSFAWLLAPLRPWGSLAPRLIDEVLLTGIQLYL